MINELLTSQNIFCIRLETSSSQVLLQRHVGPILPHAKLMWVRDNEPENYEKVYKLLLPKDYVRFKLTGELVTDMTDASGTLFLNIHERKWSPEMAEMLEVDKDILPGLVESPEISGKVPRTAAEETGLPPGIPIAGGAAFGAAILGGVGAGVFKDLQEACANLIHTGDKVIPEKDRVEKYDRYFKFFQSLYPLFKPSYEELSRL